MLKTNRKFRLKLSSRTNHFQLNLVRFANSLSSCLLTDQRFPKGGMCPVGYWVVSCDLEAVLRAQPNWTARKLFPDVSHCLSLLTNTGVRLKANRPVCAFIFAQHGPTAWSLSLACNVYTPQPDVCCLNFTPAACTPECAVLHNPCDAGF